MAKLAGLKRQLRPDGQVVGPARGQCAVVHSVIAEAPMSRGHNPVELRHGLARGEAAPWGEHLPTPVEIAQAAAMLGPLVEIAHQDCGEISVAVVEVLEHGLYLAPTAKARKIKMHPNHTNAPAVDRAIHTHCPARLKRGQDQRMGIDDINAPPHQNGVAMPTNTQRTYRDGSDLPVPFLQHLPRQAGGPLAETAVRFLDRHDVRIDLVKDCENPFRIALPVEPDCLVDVIAGEFQVH